MTEQFGVVYTATQENVPNVYNLNGTNASLGITLRYLGDQGFGLAPLHRITVRGPLQHGDSDVDFRLDPRVLQLPLLVQNTSATPRFRSYEIREKILRIFRPQDPGELQVSRYDGSVTVLRNIKTRVLGGLSFDVNPDNYHVRTVVQLRADDPTWYAGDYSAFWTQATFNTSQILIQYGNWPTFPQIYIQGPVTNCIVTNVLTGQFIRYNGFIPSGTVVRINLDYGKKTVTNNATGANLIANITADSSLATLYMLPGGNQFSVTGTGLGATSSVTISWSDRYTGI